MARMIFADPFGSYTQGFREGQQDELALGTYNIGARRAETDYEKALQDLRTGQADWELRQKLDPYLVRSAEAQLFEQEAQAGALGSRISGDPRTLSRAMTYFGPDWQFDSQGLTSPAGVRAPTGDLLMGANYDFVALPRPALDQRRGSTVGPWAAGYGFPPLFGDAAAAPAPTPAAEASAPPSASTAPLPEAYGPLPPVPEQRSYWSYLGDQYRNKAGWPEQLGYAFPGAAAISGGIGGLRNLQAARDWWEQSPQTVPQPEVAAPAPFDSAPPAPAPVANPYALQATPPNYGPAERTLLPAVGAVAPGLAADYQMVRSAGSALQDMSPEQILARLRLAESSNRYRIGEGDLKAPQGAYQYYDKWWANYGGYPRASMAPPEVQDRRALEDFARAYQRFGNPYQAIANHIYPKYARDPRMWDERIPNNPITMRQYVSKVLGDENVRRYLDAVRR